MKTKEEKAAYAREWRKKNPERARAIQRKSLYAYLKRTGYKSTRAWAERNKEKIKAEQLLNREILKGTIKREKCRDCEEIKTHGHHFDYKQPLNVIWLCPVHHQAEHRNIYA